MTDSGLFFHHVDEKICSKPFVSLIVCDNLDPEMPRNARDYFRTFARFMDAPHVGELIRSGGRLIGYGHDPQAKERFPKINSVYAAYEQAGRELAINGCISNSIQRKANQEIIPVPFFGLLKRLSPFKRVMVQKAEEHFTLKQCATYLNIYCCRPTQIAPDLPTAVGYAATKAKSGHGLQCFVGKSGRSGFRSRSVVWVVKCRIANTTGR